MYYILFTIILIFCFFESIFKKNKIKDFFFIMTGLLLIIIQSFNTWAPDLENYKIQFDYIDEEYVRNVLEPVHKFLIETVKNYGGSFENFIFIYGLLIMIPFLFFIKKSTPLPIFVLSIFYIIPFFPDITQIRVFLAFAIFLFAIPYFKTNKIIFYSLYILSVFCHYSLLSIAFFFILRKFAFYSINKKNNIIILFGVLALTAIPKSIANDIVFSVNAKYNGYLEGTNTYIGTVVLFIPFFILNNCILYHYKKNKEYIEEAVSDKYKTNIPVFIELIKFSNYLILLQYFIRDFSRITMNLSILSFIYISIILFYGYKRKCPKSNLLILRYSVYIWVGLTFYITFLMLNNGDYMKIIEKTFSSNSLYGE